MTTRLSQDEIERYSRQIMIPDFGGKGQIRLRESKALVIGAGGLGSPAAFYLAAAGVGALGLIDGDRVELSNLQRQILHATADLGRLKVESAAGKRGRAEAAGGGGTPGARPSAPRRRAATAPDVFADYDFIVDGSDNFETKFLVNDTAVTLGKAFSHAGIVRLQGQTMPVVPPKSACYRCVFQEPPAPGELMNCQQAGILGVVAGVIGAIQATEAIKYLSGMDEELLMDRVLTYDAKTMNFRTIEVRKNPACAACGEKAERRSHELR